MIANLIGVLVRVSIGNLSIIDVLVKQIINIYSDLGVLRAVVIFIVRDFSDYG